MALIRENVKYLSFFILSGFLIIMHACDQTSSVPIEESLDVITNLEPIPEAQNVTVTIKRGDNTGSFFVLNFDKIEAGNIIGNELSKEGWCIEWKKSAIVDEPLEDSKLFSTFGSKTWKDLNYFLNIKDQLIAQNPNIGFREVQLVIWSLVNFPEFDINTVPLDEIPGRMKDAQGEPLYDKNLVLSILDIVERNKDNFDYEVGQTFAVVTSLESNDSQTVITLADETFWGFDFRQRNSQNSLSFRSDYFQNATNTDGSQWGWEIFWNATWPSVTVQDTSATLISGCGIDDGTKTLAQVLAEGCTEVGSISFNLDGNDLDVTFSASGDFEFAEVHLWVGCNIEDIPKNSNNFPPGQFPYSFELVDNGGEKFTSHTFDNIDASALGCTNGFYIGAHGDVEGPEEDFQ